MPVTPTLPPSVTALQGQTAHLTALYKNSAGDLVDPGSPTVDIINPANLTVVNMAVPIRDSLGTYHYDYPIAAAAPTGDWTARWRGIVDGGTVAVDDIFEVTDGSTPDALLTLEEYKAFMGITTTEHDAQVTALLGAASLAVRNYSGRSFVLATGASSDRTYLYDGSGILDTDDFVVLNSISTDAGFQTASYPLTSDMWDTMPHAGPPYYWIVFYTMPGQLGGISAEMGFRQNLDVYVRDYGPWHRVPTLTVNAQWGWPVIPQDVKLAAAWTINDALSEPADQNLAAEAIEGYSRSWANQGTVLSSLAVPNSARDLLAPYTREYA